VYTGNKGRRGQVDAKIERLMNYTRGFRKGAAGVPRDPQGPEDWQRGYEDGQAATHSAIDAEAERLNFASSRRLRALASR
jgi:hypothetical protein